MAQIADGYVLTDVKAKIATAGREHERARNGRRPDDLAIHQALDVLHDRVTAVARLAKRRIGVGAEQHRVGAVDADKAQLADRLGDGVGIFAHIGWKSHYRIAGPLAYAADPARGVAVEDGAVFRKGDQTCRVLRGLPVRVIGSALHVVDLLPIKIKRHAQLNERVHLTLPRQNAFHRGPDVA